MRWISLLVVIASLVSASVDTPGADQADNASNRPNIVKPVRSGRTVFNLSNSFINIRVSTLRTDIRVSPSPEPQKPIDSGNAFSERPYKNFPVEPVQPPTVTVYTF